MPGEQVAQDIAEGVRDGPLDALEKFDGGVCGLLPNLQLAGGGVLVDAVLQVHAVAQVAREGVLEAKAVLDFLLLEFGAIPHALPPGLRLLGVVDGDDGGLLLRVALDLAQGPGALLLEQRQAAGEERGGIVGRLAKLLLEISPALHGVGPAVEFSLGALDAVLVLGPVGDAGGHHVALCALVVHELLLEFVESLLALRVRLPDPGGPRIAKEFFLRLHGLPASLIDLLNGFRVGFCRLNSLFCPLVGLAVDLLLVVLLLLPDGVPDFFLVSSCPVHVLRVDEFLDGTEFLQPLAPCLVERILVGQADALEHLFALDERVAGLPDVGFTLKFVRGDDLTELRGIDDLLGLRLQGLEPVLLDNELVHHPLAFREARG